MFATGLIGAINGVNTIFQLPVSSPGLVLVISQSRVLRQVSVTPGPYEFTLSGLTVTVGQAPPVGAMFFAYLQIQTTLSLEEVTLTGIQNNSNQVFRISKLTAPGTSLLLFKNGGMLQPTASAPNSVQYVPLTAVDMQLGLAPTATDRLRAFVSVPATALIQPAPLSGPQDSANTRYTVSGYTPPAATEPLFFITVDGILQARTLMPPLAGQFLMTSPVQFVLGVAPAAATVLQTVLVGSTPVVSNPYQFTLDKLSRRIGIWLARGLDEAECEEVTRETYREYMEMYQWSFLMVEGALTTTGQKTTGTVQVTQGSRVVQGTGTAFDATDVGKRFRLDSFDNGYQVTAVDVAAQRLEIHPAYVSDSASAQPYVILQTVYSLGVDTGYLFSMAGRCMLREIPLSVLNRVDPTRYTTGTEPLYYAYRGRNERDELLVEIYPVPDYPVVLRYTAIRREALTDGAQALRGIETIVLNASAAAGCRVAMAKGGKATAEMWMQLMGTYETKAAQLLERIDALDWTRSDVAKVQGMREDTYIEDGSYASSHDLLEW